MRSNLQLHLTCAYVGLYTPCFSCYKYSFH